MTTFRQTIVKTFLFNFWLTFVLESDGIMRKKESKFAAQTSDFFAHKSPGAPRGLFAGRVNSISPQPNTFSIWLTNARKASLEETD